MTAGSSCLDSPAHTPQTGLAKKVRPSQVSSGPTMPPAQTGGMGLHKVETTPPAAANPEPPTQTSRLFRIKPFADPQNSFGPGLQI